MGKVRVLVIDDSAVVREILNATLSKHPQIDVVATAVDPFIAREKIAKFEIDVITLDIEMPRMDGLTFLKYLMRYHPIPVVVLSSLADRQNRASLDALELGAVDIVPKPGGPYSVEEITEFLAERILAAARIDFAKVKSMAEKNRKEAAVGKEKYLTHIKTTRRVIAVGASTGGTSTMEMLFKKFDHGIPPALAVIHMPERFTRTFADRLNELCAADVKEAEDGEGLLSGTVYIAPGNTHMQVRARGAERFIRLSRGPKLHNQRPSVDVLFQSVADHVGKNAIGVILTGMGCDGAAGLLEMRRRGAYTIAQDERTSIVFGMPKEAIARGAADIVLPIERIAGEIRLKVDE